MKLTVYTLDDKMFTLDVAAELELENFKALCEFECGGIPAREIAILNNGVPLRDDKKTLGAFGLKDGDVVVLQRMRNQQATSQGQAAAAGGLPFSNMFDFSNIQVPGTASSSSSQQASRSQQRPPPARQPQRPAEEPDPASLLELLRNSPHDRALLKERNPPLSEAVESGDLAKFTEVLTQQRKERAEKEAQRIRLLTADPFDPEVQRLINEEIQQKNIEENMNVAMEEMPESFGQVVMLYIDCMVNGHPVKAFVDSGAQMTIMSKACAERCNIMRLVDKRWAGIAKGVGTQKIIGRVHVAQIQIQSAYLQSSFSVLEDQPMDMLLGLDMLRRHQCTIDLKKNVLLIGSSGTETPFLSEADLPECARLHRQISDSSLTDQEREDRALAEALAKSAEEAGRKPRPAPLQPVLPELSDTSSPPLKSAPPTLPPGAAVSIRDGEPPLSAPPVLQPEGSTNFPAENLPSQPKVPPVSQSSLPQGEPIVERSSGGGSRSDEGSRSGEGSRSAEGQVERDDDNVIAMRQELAELRESVKKQFQQSDSRLSSQVGQILKALGALQERSAKESKKMAAQLEEVEERLRKLEDTEKQSEALEKVAEGGDVSGSVSETLENLEKRLRQLEEVVQQKMVKSATTEGTGEAPKSSTLEGTTEDATETSALEGTQEAASKTAQSESDDIEKQTDK